MVASWEEGASPQMGSIMGSADMSAGVARRSLLSVLQVGAFSHYVLLFCCCEEEVKISPGLW
jgi:hypothetical protein